MSWFDNYEVPHADRDWSNARQPLASDGTESGEGTPGTPCPTKASLSEHPVYGDVRHHRERIDQLKDWVRQWKFRADKAESRIALLEGELRESHAMVAFLSAQLAERDSLLHSMRGLESTGP